MTRFESVARRGCLSAFWAHYQEVLRRSTHEGELQVASNGEVSFGMIEPDRDVALKVLPQAFTEA